MTNLAKHALLKEDNSPIIEISLYAKKAKALDNSVINATIGMLYDEEEKFYTFKCVKEAMASLSDVEKFTYTNSEGVPLFLEGVMKWVFQEHYAYFKENMHLKAVATPGGSGAISNTFSNYLNPGETVLLPSIMWSNYKQVAYENFLNYDTYTLFTKEGKFNLASLREKCLEYKAKQQRILLVLNDPCENPTGYSMTDLEWEGLINIINEVASDIPFTLLYDMAYIDYDERGFEATRNNIRRLASLNTNVVSILAFSGSKTLGLYGLRIGAMICATKNEKESVNFSNASIYSARSKYSMCNTEAMNLVARIFNDEKLKNSFIEEVKEVRLMLNKRSNAFINECEKHNLVTYPFKCGFFITIPCKNDKEAYEYLVKKGVYVVPIGKALRVTLASINLANATKLPKLIKEAIDYVDR